MSTPTGDNGSGEAARSDPLAYARSIIETVREPLVVLDGCLRVQSANRSFYRTFRVTPQETEGQRLYDLGNGQWDIPRLRTLLEEILPQATAFDDYEVEHDFPDIGRKAMLLNARRLRLEGTERILLAIEDVTERRRSEAERQEIETRFTSLVKNIKDHSIFTLDPEGRVTSWNVAAEHVLGYTEGEVLGRHFSFIFTPQDQQQGLPEAELRAARELGRAEDERWHLRKGAVPFWALGIVSALYDADGRLTGFSKILRDMTEWKRAELALRESEERSRLVALATRDTIWDWDIENDRHRWSEAGSEAFGWTDASETRQAAAWWTERVHGEDRERVAASFQHALNDPTCERWQDEYRFLRRDGSVADVLDRGFILRDASGKPKRMIGAMQDITERKVVEAGRTAAVRQAETRQRSLEAVLQALPVGVIVSDAEGGVVLANRRDEEIWGPRPVTRSVEDYRQYRARWVESGRPVLPHEWASARAVRQGEVVLGQILEIERFDGGHRCVHNSAVPIRDEQGNVIGCAVALQDITELRQAEEALREASRRKDAFLAILAHELRNPLAPLRTGLDLIEVLRGDASACEAPLRIMDRQLSHLVRLVDDLLDVSRISRGKIRLQKERLDLAEIIEAALDMSESGLSRGDRRLSVSVPSRPLPVEGDRVRLVQVVSNLLSNAAKFTDAGGHVDLRVIAQGDRVEIRVQDDGQGIPRERLDDIFEMFSQAEPGRREGLGIGLNLVRSLVAMHGGRVWADSEGAGRGATFTVSLPLCRTAPARSQARREAKAGFLAPQRRVLVVDDNRDIAEGLRLLLTTLKAEVRVAHDGAEAVHICADWQPTLVLMDLGMPGMDGYEAARRLRASHPDDAFRLVAVTGWGQDEDRQRAREAGFDEHLVKPVGVAELKALLSS